MPRLRSKSTLIFAAMLLASVSLLGCSGGDSAKGKRGKGDDPLLLLDPAFQPFRRDFEEAAGKVRLVMVLAPTCGECNEHAFEVHDQLLYRVKGEDVAVFLLWNSVLPTDVETRARINAKRWADPRGINYWDDTGQIARAFGRMLNLEPGSPAFDCYFLYDRDATFDPDGTMENEPKDYRAFKSGWAPINPTARWTSNKNIRLPRFDWHQVEARMLELLQSDGASGTAK